MAICFGGNGGRVSHTGVREQRGPARLYTLLLYFEGKLTYLQGQEESNGSGIAIRLRA